MKHYKKVIDIVSSDPDYRALVIEIAKSNPAVLIKAHAIVTRQVELEEPWRRQMIDLLKAGEFVHAIKLTREKLGIGLKEAKDFCDAEREKLGIEPPWRKAY